MPKRTKKHHSEDRSRNSFALTLPENWVLRDKDKDYGIDIEVEVFDKSGEAAGLVFWGQLKATSSTNPRTIRSVSLSISTIVYYKTLDIPVLLIRYSEIENAFYCKWAHDIDLYYRRKGAKTYSVKFDSADKWCHEAQIGVENVLRWQRSLNRHGVSLPLSMDVQIHSETLFGQPKHVVMSRLRLALDHYSSILTIPRTSASPLSQIKIDSELLRIKTGPRSWLVIHGVDRIDSEAPFNDLAVVILSGVATSIAHMGESEKAGEIVLMPEVFDSLLVNQGLFCEILYRMRSGVYLLKILDAIGKSIDSIEDNQLENLVYASVIMQSACNTVDDDYLVEKFIHQCIGKYTRLSVSSQVAIWHYNLGNFLRSRQRYRASVSAYVRAARFDDAYKTRDYYYRELAGSLFGANQFSFAAACYKRAYDLGCDSTSLALLADSLMHSGKYSEALKCFEEYFALVTDIPDAEWILKHYLLKELSREYGVDGQIRQHEIAYRLVGDASKPENFDPDAIRAALRKDLMCGYAWYNLGIHQTESGAHLEARNSFAFSAVLNPWDMEAWVNAMKCCFNAGDSLDFLQCLILAGYRFGKNDFLSNLYQMLGDGLPTELVEEFSTSLEELISNQKTKAVEKEMRMHGPEGLFMSVGY